MKQGKHFSMIRSFHLADWFTLGNASCGVVAIFAVMTHLQNSDVLQLLFACALIALAFVFDVLDGRVARWRQQTSVLGRELDSLADVISFGVAPVVIAYGAGMDGLWDRVILLYFVACGVILVVTCEISRLVCDNVQSGFLRGGMMSIGVRSLLPLLRTPVLLSPERQSRSGLSFKPGLQDFSCRTSAIRAVPNRSATNLCSSCSLDGLLFRADSSIEDQIDKEIDMTIRLPFINHIKALFQNLINDKDVALNRPWSYEIEILPSLTQRGSQQSSVSSAHAIKTGATVAALRIAP